MDSKGHFRRLGGWDYSKGASFFITLALEERRPLLGHVEGGAMVLSLLGEEVLAALEAIPRIHPEITLHGHVVMPDHVHFNCHLAAGLKEPIRLLGKAIAGFKAVTTRSPHAQCACGSTPASGPAPGASAGLGGASAPPGAESGGAKVEPGAESGGAKAAQPQRRPGARSGGASAPRLRVWRLGYHDHLCLSRRFIAATERYIAYNPLKWALMHGSSSLRIHEPLFSPRLDPAEYLIRRKSLPRARPRQRGSRLRPCRLPRRERRDRGNGQVRPRLRAVFHARGTGTAVATPPDAHAEPPRGRADPAHEPEHGVLMAEHCSAREWPGRRGAPRSQTPLRPLLPRARIRVPQPFQTFQPLQPSFPHFGGAAAT